MSSKTSSLKIKSQAKSPFNRLQGPHNFHAPNLIKIEQLEKKFESNSTMAILKKNEGIMKSFGNKQQDISKILK